jgi:predicted enzyme related to lactoylglutathione lyase
MNLNQITLPSLDLSKAIVFYNMLGLKLIVNALPDYARFECPDGESTLSLQRVNQLPSGQGIVVYFEENNLDQYVLRLREKGIEILEQPEDKPWLWKEAKLKDPDNNEIIIFNAGANRKNPPWRIKSD